MLPIRKQGGTAVAQQAWMTGMRGVYLVAAELCRLGFIVSPTSRSAAGADLLVTDQACQKAWSVQVKTNRKTGSFWLVGAKAAQIKSNSHVYVFVNLGKQERPEFVVVPSAHVAEKMKTKKAVATENVFYEFWRNDRLYEGEGWEQVFGDAHVNAADNSNEMQP
jgi:hypothetical protein